MTTMSAQDIADHLGERFRLLTGGRRTAVARHQTLQAAIEWSHRLLDPEEQQLLAHLSVFSAPSTSAMPWRWRARAPTSSTCSTASASLVNRSLVVHSNDLMPYRLLETIRAFGRMNLDAEGQSEALRWRHARHFHARAEALHSAVLTAEAPAANRLVRSQGVDYLAAVRWAHEAATWPPRGAPLLDVRAASYCYGWREPGLLAEQLVASHPRLRPGAAYVRHASWSANLSQGRPDLGAAFATTALELEPKTGSPTTLLGFAMVLSGDPRVRCSPRSTRGAGRRSTVQDWSNARSLAAGTRSCSATMRGPQGADELLERGRLDGLPVSWSGPTWPRTAVPAAPTRRRPRVVPRQSPMWRCSTTNRAAAVRAIVVGAPHRDLLAASRDLEWCLLTARTNGTPGIIIAAVPHVVVALARR